MFRFQQAFIISAVFLLCLIFVTLSWLFRLSIVLPSHLFTRLTDVILQYKSIYRKNFDKKIFFIYLACIWHFYDGVRRKEQKKTHEYRSATWCLNSVPAAICRSTYPDCVNFNQIHHSAHKHQNYHHLHKSNHGVYSVFGMHFLNQFQRQTPFTSPLLACTI